MKRTIIFSAIMAMLLSAVYTSAQTRGTLSLSFSFYYAYNGVETGTISYTGLEAPGVQVFEAVIPAQTEAACFASKDFSMARRVRRDRASVAYDHATSSYQLRWTGARERGDSCRVLLVGQSIGASDLAVWQANYGATTLSNSMTRENVSYGRSSYKLFLDDGNSSSSLSVRYPNQDGEVVEVGFPEAANSYFQLLETSFPARNNAECMANRDFSAAIPVGSDRATLGYFPSSGLWHLNNTYRGLTTVECHALFVDGDDTVDARDYVMWRSRFGSTSFAESDGLLTEDAYSIEQNTASTRDAREYCNVDL